MTEPLTPPECDLRGLEWMPLFGDRLFASETWLMASPEGRCAALALWWAAWKQKPAASLADDDRVLAQLAGYGMAIKAWRQIRDEAMRGFIKCSDGRLYHPVVAEQAIEAWERRIKDRERKARWRKGRDGGGDGEAAQEERGRDAGETGTGASPSASRDGSVRVDRTGQDRTGQEEEKEPSSLRSDGAVPARPDVRTELFRSGLAEVRRLTGMPDGRARALLGKCLKAAEDNASTVSDAIRRCADHRPADAVPWLLQACQKPQFRNGFLAVIAEEGWASEPDDPPNQFLIGSAAHGPH